MPYTPTTWVNGSGGGTKVNATNLNNMEDGIVAANAGLIPTGAVVDFAGSSAPTGYLICDGSAVSRTTYADLFALIDEDYGAGDGSTTFNLPDLRGRVSVGLGTNTAVDTLGENDGVAVANRRGTKHRHTPHSHNSDNGQSTGGGGSDPVYNADGTNNSQQVATTSVDGGSGTATDPLDGGAFLVLNKIIKT